MNPFGDVLKAPSPNALRPLLGQTVLAVEDSRFACEAIRLVCLRSGARVRRADTISAARRHLAVYRPSVVLVDMGLPDGSGAELIAELAEASPRVAVLMGTSGDDAMADAALAAGADGFLPKPIASITAFQAAILSHLPPEERPSGPRAILEDEIAPDTIAYHDDLAHALDALKEGDVAYVGQFLEGVARHAGDDVLVEQAQQLGLAPENDDLVLQTRGVIKARMGPRMAV